MTNALIETKLNVPAPRRNIVPRPRLLERLAAGSESKLTLISAPAGSGKSTLLADWIASGAAQRESVAWLSIDTEDDEHSRFWSYVIAALQRVEPAIGASAVQMFRDGASQHQMALTSLINDLNSAAGDVWLVLDDYHMIETPEIHEDVAFLLEHLPRHVHLVIATRADPPLPVPRLRARGDVIDIRAADLRFNPDEAGAYLNEMMGLALSTVEVAALEQRTEGWAAALQLAAVSMQGSDDVSAFIESFAGSDRYLVDYLVDEVLDRQPEDVRDFLMQTSILSRLTGSLCDAVTGMRGGKSTLEALERANLLIVPLDGNRHWYRYHRLFADVLAAHLLDEHSDIVAELHRRASEWHEWNEDRPEAIRHAIAGEHYDRAARLIEAAVPTMRRTRQETTLRRWLEALPAETFRVRPVLSVGYAGSLMAVGEIEGVENLLRHAERWLDGSAHSDTSGEMMVVDENEFRRLPGGIALYRAGRARILGDQEATMAHAHHAIELAADDDHLVRGGASGLLALAQWTAGDLGAAYRSWTTAMQSLERAQHLSDAIGCAIALADIRITQGRLSEALTVYERGLALATSPDGAVRRGAADMHVGICTILLERGDIEGARAHLRRAGDLGEDNGLPQNRYRSRVAAARLELTDGNVDQAIELMSEAESVYFTDFSPNVRPVPAQKARMLLRLGRPTDALRWAAEAGVSIADPLSYLREFEHMTFARALVIDAKEARIPIGTEVLDFLGRLLESAEQGGRTGNSIELSILQAFAHAESGDEAAALDAIENAIALAEPEHWLAVFVDEGPAIEPLLRLAARTGSPSRFSSRLTAAIGEAARGESVRQRLVDPLSDREIQVLRLLGADLTGPEIAAQLFVSLNTMRSHTKSIYAKLGVNSRREAVRRAAELGLLSRRADLDS